eukprot:Filipodium_phascolosomae@DN4354_c0_g1_i1.p1
MVDVVEGAVCPCICWGVRGHSAGVPGGPRGSARLRGDHQLSEIRRILQRVLSTTSKNSRLLQSLSDRVDALAERQEEMRCSVDTTQIQRPRRSMPHGEAIDTHDEKIESKTSVTTEDVSETTTDVPVPESAEANERGVCASRTGTAFTIISTG